MLISVFHEDATTPLYFKLETILLTLLLFGMMLGAFGKTLVVFVVDLWGGLGGHVWEMCLGGLGEGYFGRFSNGC